MSNLLEKASILTTPTAYDDGKILSVKPSIVLGAELVTNGDFSDGTNGWGASGEATISVVNGELEVNVTGGGGGFVRTSNIPCIDGRTYIVSIDYRTGTYVGDVLPIIDNNSLGLITPTSETQTKTWKVVAIGSSFQLAFVRSAAYTGTIYYDNVSVKEAIDGDFDFTRNSSATRVNAQGLVEDVQILSSNLVQNGDFSQEGSELVTNGGFDTDTDWSKGASWSIADGKASSNGLSNNSLSQTTPILEVGKTYKLKIDITHISGTLLLLGAYYETQISFTESGSYDIFIVPKVTTFSVYASSFIGSIDNVSVKEVGQNWTLGSFTNIGNNVANIVNSTGELSLQQNIGVSQKTIKLTYTISNYSSGGIRPQYGAVNGLNRNANGTYTEIITGVSASTNLAFFSVTANTTATITNISVIEITDDTNLPRIDYTNFDYQDVLGDELVTNGNFDSDSDWAKGTGWSITDGKVYFENPTGTEFYQSLSTTASKYRISFDLDITSGTIQTSFSSPSTSTVQSFTTSGTKTVDITTTASFSRFRFVGLGGSVFNIDNVSVKEYLGQEVVPDSGVGSWLFEPQSTNLFTQSELFSDSSWTKNQTIIEAASIILPNGLTNGYKLFANTTGGTDHRMEKTPYPAATTGQDYTLSLFVKSAGSDFIQIASSTGLPSRYQNFNISTGTKASGDISDSSITDFGNGWYRISVTETTTGTNARYLIVPILSDGGRNPIFAGNADEDGVYIWGAMLEQNSFSTSYTPTEGSIKTRLADAAFGAGSSDLINSTEGVLYADFYAEENNTEKWITLSDGTTTNRVIVYIAAANTLRIYVQNSSGGQADFGSSITLSQYNKVAFSYKENDFKLFLNGTKVGSDTSGGVPSGLDRLNLADRNGTTNPFIGNVKCVAVFKEALTDEELTCLTTI